MANTPKPIKEEQEVKDLQQARKSHELVIVRRQKYIEDIDARLKELQKGGK